MRKARILVNGIPAGVLLEVRRGKQYTFTYDPGYRGGAVSLTMPVETGQFGYDEFPPFFEGVLPEGSHLDALLRQAKIDRDDLFGQLLAVGKDLVGDVTAEEMA
jgi:serine/threonine-protein kinase HipA